VAVDAAHAWNLVAHALGLQNVPDAQVVEPCLVAMAWAVERQVWRERQP
jgi:hypothetical protein